jgi:CBS domain containing-hemolysin-like protein
MISGALDLKQKTVKQIMRKIADVFMLPVDATLDFQTMLKIESQGKDEHVILF